MTKSFFALAVILISSFIPSAVSARFEANTNVHFIQITDTGFDPENITIKIKKGESIIFENKGKNPHWPASNIHPTHTVYPGSDIENCGTDAAKKIFDACGGMDPGESFSFAFNEPGLWRFHDHLYPEYGGAITVSGETDKISTSIATETEPKQSFFAQFVNGLRNVFYRQAKDSDLMFTNDDALRSYIKKNGVTQTVLQLHHLESRLGPCHQTAHRAGHIGYDIFGSKAFIEYSAYCQSGYYHGVMEQYLLGNGTANLAESLGRLCGGNLNNFFEHQCIHGIGHGIMAWANYDLLEALKTCDILSRRRDSCWTGVFMENLGARLLTTRPTSNKVANGDTDVHYTGYLSDDPLYPCSAVAEKYQSSCYFLQTSRMIQIFGVDYRRIAKECAKVTGARNLTSCFGSMGRDVGGTYPTDAAREIKECGYVSDQSNRIACLNGAVQNSFWDSSGQDFVLSFCKMLDDSEEKSACYATILRRAPEIISGKVELQLFCAKAERKYRSSCLSRIQL